MSEQDSGVGGSGWIIAAIIMWMIFEKIIMPTFERIKSDFISAGISLKTIFYITKEMFIDAYNSFLFLLTQWKFYLALLIIFSPFMIYLNYKIHKVVFKWQDRKASKKQSLKARQESLLMKRKELEKQIILPIDGLSSNELRELKNVLNIRLDSGLFPDMTENIFKKIKEIQFEIPIVTRKERIEDLGFKEEIAKEKIEQLEIRIKEKVIELREFEETSLRKMNADNIPVFIECDMTEKEKGILLKYGYKRAYEYCLNEEDYIHVLVKPTMKHSVTHTFLVWSAMKWLFKIKDITNIIDWDTREADITFKYSKQLFAIEIETGTLLKKKHQLRAKIDYLNRKFKNRWMIVVSKKAIASKYSKFGLVSTRSEFQKKLKKLLKNA